ncbi:hypothetical protein B0A55_05783 [Friedmanniomyces simplex]|uniref:Uncharacterized protein n=1 Tax=Friedmanniomyces simplex TaxID=329884 RepID=A0A4U0XEZ7_9PEZI|nr:hypothetical protein B0A55_05783 [Friedmanniomyces simplex]
MVLVVFVIRSREREKLCEDDLPPSEFQDDLRNLQQPTREPFQKPPTPSTMGFFDVVKALLAPALIALTLYTLGAYVLLPLYRRHHSRYTDYLPLSSLSSHTSSLWSRIGDTVSRVLLPRSLRWLGADGNSSNGGGVGGVNGGGNGAMDYGDEQWVLEAGEGERMVGFGGDVERLDRGRDERGGRIRVVGGPGGRVRGQELDSQRRLSRDLEEGFRDESSEEGEEGAGGGGGGGRR